MTRDSTLDLPFDQYQRYRLVADILESMRAPGERFSVLDVGGRTALLRQFLPEDEVFLVDVEASECEGLVLGDGSRLPYADGCVDAIVTFDTLEHVPPARRAAFVAECARVARRWVVIAGPYQSPRVEDAETKLETFIHTKLEEEHRYLAEHKANGLPDREATERGLRAAGAEVVSIGHANIERWLALMCMSLYMDRDAPLRGIAKQYFHFYNSELYASDHAEPVYRHAVVAAFDGAPLPDAGQLLAPPVATAGALDLSMEVVQELLRFDVQRDAIAPEWARLEEVNQGLALDLEGHKQTLLALRTVQDEQSKVIAELEGECIDLRSNEEELEEEIEREREESQAAIQALGEDLSAHKEQLAEVEQQVGEFKALVAELERAAELERSEHAAVQAALEEDLVGHKGVIAALKADLASLTEALAQQTELREQSDAARETMKRDLDGHRALVDDLRIELVGAEGVNLELSQIRQAEAEQASVEIERASEAISALEERASLQRSELEQTFSRALTAEEGIAAIRAEFQAQSARLHETELQLIAEREVIAQLRQDLRMRWGNLKRAFGPKPTFDAG